MKVRPPFLTVDDGFAVQNNIIENPFQSLYDGRESAGQFRPLRLQKQTRSRSLRAIRR